MPFPASEKAFFVRFVRKEFLCTKSMSKYPLLLLAEGIFYDGGV